VGVAARCAGHFHAGAAQAGSGKLAAKLAANYRSGAGTLRPVEIPGKRTELSLVADSDWRHVGCTVARWAKLEPRGAARVSFRAINRHGAGPVALDGCTGSHAKQADPGTTQDSGYSGTA